MTAGNAPGSEFLDRVAAILQEVQSAPAGERDALIRLRCGNDVQLRREVLAMLRSSEKLSDGFLNRSIAAAVECGVDPATPANTRVGPWQIVERLGVGGMGEVYHGRRADGAFEADVAIKFIRSALLNPSLRERFLRERQILATLDHPNIARLLDGGVTEHGQPYLVMELVRGESLLQYCDARRLTLHQRLTLFELVCDAAQHAHSNLIVHRDLKPSNILVDETGRPRLVDFGIAAILGDTESPGTITAGGERRFTPQYAAPEQVRGEQITVATDVYALGMILYELLTGSRPYEVASSLASTPEDARVICDTYPPRPSRRLEAGTEDSPMDLNTIAQARGSDPHRLRRTLRGDLDHIVMTALRKEPKRRYATVEALREDLEHYRRGLPVSARPDSWRYRASRFIARHRVPVAAATLLVLVLAAAAIISTTLAIRLNDRTTALHDALSERQRALDMANAQRAAAERASRRALASSSTLIKAMAAVADADTISRQHVLDDLRNRIERLDAMSLPLSADAEIATRQSLAMLAHTIGALDVALEQNRRVLDLTEGRSEEADARALSYGQIGQLQLQRGRPEEAIEALRTYRNISRSNGLTIHLTQSDVHLIEALLMIGEVDAAREILQETPFPPPPVGEYIHREIRALESRYDVPLRPADRASKP